MVLLTHSKVSTLFSDGDTLNAIVTYNFWRENKVIMVDPNRPRYLD